MTKVTDKETIRALAVKVLDFRSTEPANKSFPKSPKAKKNLAKTTKRILGKLEKLGKSFNIHSSRASFTYDYFTCDNCGNEKAHWNFSKTSLGSIHVCSRCKTKISRKKDRQKTEKSKNDAFFKVVNRKNKF